MTELNPPDVHTNGGPPTDTINATTKRQRRPSVRLGEIGGDQPFYESNYPNRKPKHPQWPTKPSSKIKPLVNLSTDRNGKANKRGPTATKRVRSNWRASSSKTDEDNNNKLSGENDDDDDDENDVGFRDFDFDRDDVSDSGLKEQSPIQSLDGDRGDKRDVSVRVCDGSDTDTRNWNNDSLRNGVGVWLNRLGLERYAPVFEIHEVDDEVLPLLTLEDLKDMGINAVGSRRKMFCSIQKLGKGFS